MSYLLVSGESHMKRLAHMLVWWPRIMQDIKNQKKSLVVSHPVQHLCHGNVLADLGVEFTLMILQVHSLTTCYSFLLTHIPNI